MDIVKSPTDIELGEVLGPLEFIDEFRDEGKGVFVLHSDYVQCSVIGMKNDIPWIIKFFIYYISNQNPILFTTGAVRIKSADYTC
jgi:hypothetical protein